MKNFQTYLAFLCLFNMSHAFGQETSPIGIDDVEKIKNRCIIRFNDNIKSEAVSGKAKGLAKRANKPLQFVYKNSIKGFTINMPCHAAEKAFNKELDGIESMRPDGIINVHTTENKGNKCKRCSTNNPQFTLYGVKRVGGPFDVSGQGYTAWILDSGIDLNHADLNVDASRGFNTQRGSVQDQNGHGTHVAGIIGAINNNIDTQGVAAGTTVIPVRVLNRKNSGSWSAAIAGLDYVANNAKPGECVNMSFGGDGDTNVDDALRNAAQKSGAFFVISAGNDARDALYQTPARVNGSNIWTISSIDINDRFASSSNYGNAVDYAAPGEDIRSLKLGGGTTGMSGTSMAAPHACAILMLTNGQPRIDGYAEQDPDGNADPIIHY